MGVSNLIVTLGSKGSLLLNRETCEFHLALQGKSNRILQLLEMSFIGGLVRELKDNNVGEAIEFATKVSAIAVTRKGAQTSIPTIEEVENLRG